MRKTQPFKSPPPPPPPATGIDTLNKTRHVKILRFYYQQKERKKPYNYSLATFQLVDFIFHDTMH